MDGTVLVPKTKIGLSIAIIMAVQGFGMFSATYFTNFLQGLLHTNSVTSIFPALALLAIIGAIYSFIAAIMLKDNKKSALAEYFGVKEPLYRKKRATLTEQRATTKSDLLWG